MVGLGSGLVSSGSKSSSRSARGSSRSAVEIRFVTLLWTPDCKAVNDKEVSYKYRLPYDTFFKYHIQ